MNSFKERGWADCLTSRHESKRLDDAGVDLCHTAPFYVQCKAVEKIGSMHEILGRMPKEESYMNVVFHKRSRKGTVVSMSEETFWRLAERVR